MNYNRIPPICECGEETLIQTVGVDSATFQCGNWECPRSGKIIFYKKSQEPELIGRNAGNK